MSIEYATVPLSDLRTYPHNPRQGDIDAIADSLVANGQYRPIVVQKSSGQILAGNHTYLAAKGLDWKSIEVAYVDVDDERAARIVLVDNRTADLGDYDETVLTNLLTDLPDLDGTGYTTDDLDELLADLRDAAADAEDAAAGEGDGEETIRSVVLSYSGSTYRWMVDRLAELGDKHGTETDAETILRLVERATKKTAPEGDDE